MIVRGELKQRVLTTLNQTPSVRGNFSDAKLDWAIQEALDRIAVEMFLVGEGWRTKIQHFDVADGTVSIPVPQEMVLINEVRALYGDVYVPLALDNQRGASQLSASAGSGPAPWTYRLVDGAFYFNPAINPGGTAFLQVEYTAYPTYLSSDGSKLPGDYDNAMLWFVQYRAASTALATVGDGVPPWIDRELEWKYLVQRIIARRNNRVKYVRPFEG